MTARQSAQVDPFVLGAGFLLHLQLGTPYAYGLLRPSFVEAFGLGEVAAAAPFSAILIFYTLGMLIGGVACDRIGPRRVGVLGALLFGGGYALAGLAASFGLLLAAYGVLCGFGIGLAYMAAVHTAVRRHPGCRGLATGVVVLGFGLSSAVFALIVPGLLAGWGWRSTLLQMGLLFTVLSLALTWFLDPRPAEKREETLDPPASCSNARLRRAWLAWALALTVGLGWLGQLPELARYRGWDAQAIPMLLTMVALANGLSRPLLGFLSDRLGRFNVLASVCALGMFALAVPLATPNPSTLWATGVGVGLAFGGLLVNMAPLASEWAGSQRAGALYGVLFTSYGVGALCGPLAIAELRTVQPDDRLGLAVSIVLLASSGALFLSLQRSAASAKPAS